MVINDLKTAFPDLRGLSDDSSYRSRMNTWLDVYSGNPPWRSAKRSGLHSRGERRIGMLNAAKAICEEFTGLTLAEKFNFEISVPEYQAYLEKVLERTRFQSRLQKFVTDVYALGGGCIKLYATDGVPEVDFITAEKIFPVSFKSGKISEVIFRSQSYEDGHYITLLEKYKPNETQNLTFISDNKLTIGNQTVGSLGTINSKAAGIFSPFITAASNNFDLDSPLGISIFANCLDTLKAIDIAFDSLMREFILGKKRIIVPAASIQTVIDPDTGNLTRYFDSDDEAFVALKTEDNDTLKITDNTVELRVEEHITAINALFNLLCFQVGVSSGTFSLSNGLHYYTKTATEVISQNSKSARTIKCNQNALAETLTDILRGLITIGQVSGELNEEDFTLKVGFFDNVVTADTI
ncbi:MAG: phage portal protein [Ruminococcus sp.]|jgi:A118 family predicted phage portal protein|nr:phage portal protein [Ruminococcus sp.]